MFRRLGNSSANAARTRESLRSDNLVVEVAIAKAVLSPVIEVVCRGDCAGRALVLADRPVLREGGSTSDGRLVSAGVGADGVDTAVAGDGADFGHAGLAGTAWAGGEVLVLGS